MDYLWIVYVATVIYLLISWLLRRRREKRFQREVTDLLRRSQETR